MKSNHRDKSNETNIMETQDFSLEVHVLAGMVVSVVSTNTWWFRG